TGTSNEYARGDHQHPLQVSTVLPAKDTANGEAGVAATYARSDHTHHVNLSNDVPLKDTGIGTVGASNVYASTTHQHPLNVDPTTANVPLVNATAAANGTSDFYSRNDNVHPQQLTYTGPLTSTMFIKNGAQATDILLAGCDSKPISYIAGDGFVVKTGKTIQEIQSVLHHSGDDEESENDEDYITRGTIYNQYVSKESADTITAGTPLYVNYRGTSLSTQYPNSKLVQNYVLNAGSSSSFAGVKCGLVQINTNGNNYNQGLRIARSTKKYCGIYLGCDPNSTSGTLSDQWNIADTAAGEFRIGVGSQVVQDNKGLIISADGNTLSFNGSVIAGVGATNGASNGSVNYSVGNPILWGVNSVGTEGGFYSDGPKVYWRAKPITLGAVPP
ncbi:MAG: hypothetical protein EZS28_022290, partial [Streblomastix strix]